MPIIAYLNEDFETLPELHAFLGNYRRYCISVIEGIACAMPQEAVTYVLEQTTQIVDSICQEFCPPFTSKSGDSTSDNILTIGADAKSSKAPLPVLQLESQASVVRSTLNGFGQWLGKLHDAGGVSSEQSSPQLLADCSQPAFKEAYRGISTTLCDFCYKIMSAQPQVGRSKTLLQASLTASSILISVGCLCIWSSTPYARLYTKASLS